MNKFAIVLVLAGISVGVASADFAKAKDDLRFEFENYTKTHQEYAETKAKYQQFKTLPTETDAFEALKRVLADRSAVLSAYFAVFIEKLNATGGMSDAVRNDLISEATAERNFLAEFKRKALNAKNVEEVENLSTEFQNRQDGWQNIISKVKVVIFSSSIISISDRTSQLIGKVENALAGSKISDISDLNLRDEKIAQAKDKIREARDLSSKSQNSFLTIKFDAKKFEAKRVEDDSRSEAEKAKILLTDAITAVSEAGRGF